ncbi:MAG: hypothetical protein AVDCRST_MAG95-295 [uncultured Adhaeribacter sp.]|uniref:Uncharacterized protein n=1 Tax=uncultured Adhaeribacter sp. TaxID=448109 RepID=A0A6J4H606_9BACT|nr:MAG: hypothetical protein AVDCRST_MAG95-295 [uncultured Adhaeribacter sp.]
MRTIFLSSPPAKVCDARYFPVSQPGNSGIWLLKYFIGKQYILQF